MATMLTNGLKNFTGRNFAAAFIGVLGILGAQREKVWANDITFRETIYNTDYAVAAVGGLRNSSSAMMNVDGISGTVNKAYLYWHGPMNSTNPLANATIRLNSATVTGENIGYSDDNCWGFNNSQAYRADVTSLVQAERNGTYFLSQFVKQGTNVNANGASLLVFFNDSNDSNNRDIVLFEGNDSNADNFYDAPGWNVLLEGINYSSGRGIAQLHISDGQIYEDADVVLNGELLEQRGQIFQGTTVLAANNGPGGTGRLWDVKNYDITPVLAAGSNTISITHAYLGTSERLKGDCVSLVVAAINLPAGSAPPPPANIAPVVTGLAEVTVNTPDAIPLQAQVTDQDGNPLTYSIAIDGTAVLTGGIPAGIPVTSGTLDIINAFGLGQHTVVFTANDGQASSSFTTVVNVIDNTPPVLNIPENMTVPSAPGRTNAVVRYEVTASDDFPGVTVLSLPPSGSTFPIGITTVTATAVDASGNRVQKTFTITVTDSLPPTVNCPGNLFRGTDPGMSNAVVHFTATATDNMPGVSVPNCNPPSGSTFQLGITAVNCSARDANGNSGSCMFYVTVIDREPPVLIVPQNQSLAVDAGQNTRAVHFAVEIRDNVPGATVDCSFVSGSLFTLGVTTVVCIGSDVGNNHVTNSFTVTLFENVLPQNQPPVVTVPGNLIVPNEPGTSGAAVGYTATVTDDQPGATLTCFPPSGATFALGATRVVCVGTDNVGSKSTNSFTITVIDIENPVLTLPPNITQPVDAGQNTAVVAYIATATDNSGSVSLACVPPSGSAFAIGTTTVTCNAVDNAGNVSSGSFTVTVTNSVTEPPDFGCIITSHPVLWPPNHKMVPVSVWLNFDKKKVKFSSVRIVSVTSNEPETGLWPNDIGPDWEITNGKQLKLKLRAERDDNGNGRIYTITVEGKDSKGNLYLCKTTVTVPKDAPVKCKKGDKKDGKKSGKK